MDIELAGARPRLDDRPLAKRIGLVVLATDHTTEVDFARLVAGERIGVYTARIAYTNPTTPDNLRRMRPSLTEGARLILPDEALDAVVYSCTSASVVIGDEAVAEAIRAGKPGTPVVTPTLAACRGFAALNTRRISILAPYSAETSRPMAAYFERHGFVIDRFLSLGFEDDREMARIAPDDLVALAVRATDPRSEALFVSCTAVRAAGIAVRIEAAIDRPMISSNLATAWECLRRCGDATPRPQWGRLMTRPMAGD